jgi:hypothetical protein
LLPLIDSYVICARSYVGVILCKWVLLNAFLSIKTTLRLSCACANFSSIHYTRHDTTRHNMTRHFTCLRQEPVGVHGVDGRLVGHLAAVDGGDAGRDRGHRGQRRRHVLDELRGPRQELLLRQCMHGAAQGMCKD